MLKMGLELRRVAMVTWWVQMKYHPNLALQLLWRRRL
jgi:hypothetical protein